ncbi:MAG TPA: AAA family ATPase [Candidatus Limnocylindrales bacterium]|nr:AAA family ATPase [Candidatus Limnocylindrales bacterium]
MRITRLHVSDLRRHADLELELARGLTIVRGPNESGKTTIQRAIELGLTRRVTSASADVDGLRPWGAAEDVRPVVRLDFEQEEDDGVHTGFVEKAFRGAKGSVRMEYEGQTISDPALADQVLAELTGIPTEAFFRSTASVRHHEVDDLARDEGALRDRLQASISGADRGTSRARKKLDKALHELNTRGDKNPGRLKIAEAEVVRHGAAVEQGELALAQLERDRDRLSLAREQRADADAALTERRALLEKARQAERLIAERDAAQAKFERYRTATQVSEEIATLGETHPSRDALPVLRQSVNRLREIDMRIRELRAILSGEVEVKYELEAPEPRSWRPTAIAALGLIGIGIVLAAVVQLGVLSITGGLGVPLAMVVGGFVLAFIGRRQRIWAQSFERQKQLRDVEIDRRLRGRSQLEQELQQAELDAANQLSGLELPDLAAAEALLEAEEMHVSKIEVLSAQLTGLVGREPPDALPGIRDAAALEVDQKTGALEALGPIAKEPRARERLEVEVRDAEHAVESARDEEANARARVEQNAVDAEEVASNAERLAMWEEQLAELQRRGRVYDLTLKAIDAAERATMRTATRYLEKHMVGDLERVTDGRYRRVRVDDATLGIELFAPERGDWVDVAALSQGTLDLVYLAARIGLVRLVTGDRRPPLVLDDPFVTLDDDRARRALELLRTISTDFQVIYLTCSDRYDGAADEVRILEGPTAADTEAAGAA